MCDRINQKTTHILVDTALKVCRARGIKSRSNVGQAA